MIVIPAQGMIDVRDAMTDFLTEFGKEDIGNKNWTLAHQQ